MVYLSREKGEDSARLSWKCGSRRLGSGIAAGWRIWKEPVLGCSVPESSRRYAAEQHFASALAKPSSSTHDFEVGTGSWRGDHPWKMAGRSRQYSDRHHSTMLALGALP